VFDYCVVLLGTRTGVLITVTQDVWQHSSCRVASVTVAITVFQIAFLAFNISTVSEAPVLHTRVLVSRGGATVLKVGGTNYASGASRKFFFDPPTFWPVGGQNIA